MKILEIIHGLNPGGAERLVVDLCNELSKTEDVTLLLIKKNVGSNSFYMKELSEEVKILNLDFEDGFNLSYPWKVYKAIKNINPDIVHIHCVLKYCLLALFLDSWNRKYYMTMHIDMAHIKSKIENKIAFNTVGKIDKLRIIAISKTNYEEFKLSYPKNKVCLIYNGRKVLMTSEKYDTVVAELNAFKKNPNTTIVLNVSRCTTQKNHKLLINTIKELEQEKYDIASVIIGNGYFDTELGKELQSLANGCNVHFLGTRNNITDYMTASDVFCFSSNFEGMPITAIEAILAGKPILSTPVCGVVDVVKNGINGLISKDLTKESFLDMFHLYFLNKDKLKETSKKQDKSPYTIETCAKKYIEYFKD